MFGHLPRLKKPAQKCTFQPHSNPITPPKSLQISHRHQRPGWSGTVAKIPPRSLPMRLGQKRRMNSSAGPRCPSQTCKVTSLCRRIFCQKQHQKRFNNYLDLLFVLLKMGTRLCFNRVMAHFLGYFGGFNTQMIRCSMIEIARKQIPGVWGNSLVQVVVFARA